MDLWLVDSPSGWDPWDGTFQEEPSNEEEPSRTETSTDNPKDPNVAQGVRLHPKKTKEQLEQLDRPDRSSCHWSRPKFFSFLRLLRPVTRPHLGAAAGRLQFQPELKSLDKKIKWVYMKDRCSIKMLSRMCNCGKTDYRSESVMKNSARHFQVLALHKYKTRLLKSSPSLTTKNLLQCLAII